MNKPAIILVFSGKRKCGKDFVTDILLERIGSDKCIILRLSSPLKQQYAIDNHLDYKKLLDASSYKEQHRDKMIVWGEEQRQKDPAYFCRLATEAATPQHRAWIISDARRKTDMAFFHEVYPEATRTVRVCAEESVRKHRGFVHTAGIDDAESECDLDEGVQWDFTIINNGDRDELELQLAEITQCVQDKLTV